MLSGKLRETFTLFSSSLLLPHRVGSTAGGSTSNTVYHTMAYKCTLFTFSWKDSSVGCKYCKEEVVFLAFDIFLYQDIIWHLVIDSCWNHYMKIWNH